MKISNLKAVKILALLNVTLLTVCVFIIILLQFIPHNLYLTPVVIVISVLLSVLLLRIKYIEIDESAACLTIRKIHPFAKKGYVSPIAEFPKTAIRHFEIRNHIFGKRMKIIIQSRSITKRFQFNLFLFRKKHLNQIINVLRMLQKDI